MTVIDRLRAIALELPEVEEGVACEGTPIEKRTIKVRGKAFLFLGRDDAMLKLEGSLAEAEQLAERSSGRIKAGKGGWVTIKSPEAKEQKTLARWVVESHALMASAKPAKKKTAKKTAKKAPAKKRS